MDQARIEQLLLVAAAALLVATQVGLWWRSGKAAPQATWMSAFTQASALAVLALYLAQAGLRSVAVVLGTLAATALAGVASGTRATHRVAREHGTSWAQAHRHGLRSAVVAVEAVVAAVAVALAVSWGAETFNGDFNGNADESLCKVLGDEACGR